MKKGSVLYLILTMMITTMVLSACGDSDTSSPASNGGNGQEQSFDDGTVELSETDAQCQQDSDCIRVHTYCEPCPNTSCGSPVAKLPWEQNYQEFRNHCLEKYPPESPVACILLQAVCAPVKCIDQKCVDDPDFDPQNPIPVQ